MSWSEYVRHLVGDDNQATVGAKVGASGPTVSRWLAGSQPDAKTAIALARAYGDSPLNALVAVGFITAAEARQRPVATPSLDSLDDDQLADEIRDRLKGRRVFISHATDTDVVELQAARSGAGEPGNPGVNRAGKQAEASQDSGGMDPS